MSAVALMREYGAAPPAFDRVLTHSGAPRGSVYHHFPGGRVQLIEEAVAATEIHDLLVYALRHRSTPGRAGRPGAHPDAEKPPA